MPSNTEKTTLFDNRERFSRRHIGPRQEDIGEMLRTVGIDSLEELLDQALPGSIRMRDELSIGAPLSEREVLTGLQELSDKNIECRNFIGMGYDECITPPVIKRCILESPGWYTAYTPYQPEISQGRLEALLNFQTMVIDLTGLEVANSSLLDEGTAAAEAMTLCLRLRKRGSEGKSFFVSDRCHPQVIEVLRTRALPIGVEVIVGDHRSMQFDAGIFGTLIPYPDTDGRIHDYTEFCRQAHESGALVVVAADLLALTLLTPPGEFGADVAIGSTQRFGQPLGFGGPHAAYLACKAAHKRQIPGRVVGVSIDAEGNPAIRLAMQTREQHIRRDKATSNICTSQVLLAVIASAYAVYHGPEGLRRIAERIHLHAAVLARIVEGLGHTVAPGPFFDTLRITPSGIGGAAIIAAAESRRMNLRLHGNGDLGVSLGETVTSGDLVDLYQVFGGTDGDFGEDEVSSLAAEVDASFPEALRRTGSYLDNPVFHLYRSETELMRYLHRLESRDLALNTAMIPLGSCTMKLNAAAEMFPIGFPGFANIHPFAPASQAEGYRVLLERLGGWLAEITGFSAVSFMPNSGAQGEYSGLQVIRAYHASRDDHKRDICLIPESAHGTNPASAVMAGMHVVVVACDEEGNIDPADLRAKAEEHRERLGALMITYPSTHGIFEEAVQEICQTVHANGGQVYLDGANMNALVGVCRLVDLGADVCHLNLHKTFSNPHGGGGPGMGPIAVAPHLAVFLPTHPVVPTGGQEGMGAVSSAPFGSAGILPIPYAYIAMMGTGGLKEATGVAVLAANYVARRLEGHFDLLYSGRNGLVAHECIIDTRPFREIGISVDDIAKRLMDYGFHAPTMSWPVAGTLMVEPTESESRAELDRFCDAMIMIREEIREVEEGSADPSNNVLTNSPHTAQVVASEDWDRPYSREKAAFPTRWTRENKFWPYVARVDNAHGDRNLVCACPAVETYK